MTAIVGRADGIPLYAVETVRMLLAEGRLALEGGVYRPVGDLASLAVPETLTALIASRLDALEPADRALVSDAAVLGQSFTLPALAAVSGDRRRPSSSRACGRSSGASCSRVEADPRSPERGQYAFVQALIREVAYNTLAQTRPQGAPPRGGALLRGARLRRAGRRARRPLPGGLRERRRGAEADALAGQARIALRGAAERAAALGAHDQAVAFFRQALTVTTDPAEKADLHERAAYAAEIGLRFDEATELMERAIELYHSVGDRPREATATAYQAYWQSDLGRPEQAIELLQRAWSELSDLAETEAGARLMVAFAQAYGAMDDMDHAIPWADRAAVVGERLDLVEVIVRSLHTRGSGLIKLNRSREGSILIDGAGSWHRALACSMPRLGGEPSGPSSRSGTIRESGSRWRGPVRPSPSASGRGT